MRPRLRVLVPLLGTLVAAAASGADAAATPPARPEPSAPVAPPPAGRVKPRLATWREAARPPGEVPPTALVRAAKRDRTRAARRAAPGPDVKPEPVEIVWHAPGS